LEAWSKSKTSDAITALGKLRPTTALLLVPNSDISLSSTPRDIEKAEASVDHSSSWPGHAIQKIGAELLEAGDIVRVPQGSSPPADGIVVGRPNAIITSFDESSLTGESKLVNRADSWTLMSELTHRHRLANKQVMRCFWELSTRAKPWIFGSSPLVETACARASIR
jgi:Cu+-exporting ATPase